MTKLTLRQLMLLMLVKRGRVSAPAAAELFDASEEHTRSLLTRFRRAGLARLVGRERASAQAAPRAHYGPTETTAAAIKIPRNTRLGPDWRERGGHERKPRGRAFAKFRTFARRRRVEGAVAGRIEIGRGFRWESSRL